jgi:hypothetical protein
VFKSAGETEPAQKVSLKPEPVAPEDSKIQVATAFLCFVLFCLAYKCVVSKSFLGDDHVHLIWLRKAVIDPSLVLHNFYSNWLYAGTTPQCYRPMISLFMFTDFLLWHRNAIGFHITNFVFHLLSCIALYGCVYEVRKWSPRTNMLTLWPVLAAGTFALYPSHPEAVSWVTGRVDAIVTTFYLASIYFFMLWRRTAQRRTFVAALAFMLLSLASKEMAVTIPFVWFFFELFKPQLGASGPAAGPASGPAVGPAIVSASGPARGLASVPASGSISLSARIKTAVVHSLPAWGLLVAYLCLRKIALGTFIGGYDDSLAIDKALLLQQWTAGLHMFFVPLNAYYASDNAWLTPLWIVLTSAIYVVSIFSLSKRAHRDQLLFFVAFTAISLAPVYKLFNGVPDLEGSRFSYLASAPLAAFFAFGLAYLPALFVRRQTLNEMDSSKSLQAIVCLAYFCTATFMLWLNNQPWSVAGRWVTSLEKSFNVILANPPAGTKFAFFNIPNNYRGAYLARNAISDIGQHPDADWKALEPDDKHSETGQIRQAIADGGNNYQTYYWNDDLGKFAPVRLSRTLNAQDASDWNALPLNEKCSIIQGGERISGLKNAREWAVSAGVTPIMLTLNFQKLQPSSIEFLQIDSVGTKKKPSSQNGDISLLVSSSLLPTTLVKATLSAPSPRTSVSSESKMLDEKLLFTLRLIPGWFSTSDKSSMVVLIPPTWSGSFQLNVKEDACVLPSLRRVSKVGDVSAKAFQLLSFDVSKIPTATRAVLQISRKNECFSNPCTFDFDGEHSGKVIPLASVRSDVNLTYDDLNGDGQYQVRCWALDSVGKRVGVSSDYLFITAQKASP